MKLISRYSSEKPLYYAVFSSTETHTFQTRSYAKFLFVPNWILFYLYMKSHLVKLPLN